MESKKYTETLGYPFTCPKVQLSVDPLVRRFSQLSDMVDMIALSGVG